MRQPRAGAWLGAASGAIAVVALAACSANSGPQILYGGTAGGGGSGAAAAGTALAPVVNFEMRPASIKQGQTSAAEWTTVGATACQASGAWSGKLSLNNTRGTTIGPILQAGTYTYGMSCTGAGGTTSVSKSLGVGAVPAPTIQFTVTPSTMAPGGSAVITWSTTNADSCTGSGGTGSDGWAGSKATANATGFSTGVIGKPGAYDYDLSCTGTGGMTEHSAILTVAVAAPPSPPTVSFTAQPAQILPGQSTSFSWTTSNATSCAASGGSGMDAWRGAEPTSSTGTSSGIIAAAGAYSYTLTCAGPGGSTAQSVTVVVGMQSPSPAVAVNIDATPSVIVAGQSASLTWSSTNADTCTASGSWSGSEPTQGTAVSTGTLSAPGGTATTYSYTLLCTGAGGSASGTAVVTVDPAPAAVTTFTASPPTVTAGPTTTTTLGWTTSGATSCTASGGTGSDGWGGAVAANSAGTSVGPLTTPSSGPIIYTLACTGPGGLGSPQSVSVTVNAANPPAASISSFSASPSTIQAGQSTALSWSTTSATSCTASGGAGSAWTGSVGTSGTAFNTGAINTPGNYAFTLTCTGPGGAGSPGSVVVNVTSAPTPGAATINSFTASPATIQAGHSATLAWSTSGASTCTATGGTGSDGWSGSQPTSSAGTSTGVINTAGSYTYTLNCSGAGGASGPSSVIVNVNSTPPPAASITSLRASPTSLVAGQSTSIAWSTTSATACTASGGSGADNWSGAVGVSSTGMMVGPINTVGNFMYTLTCTGPGGSSSPESVTVDVASAPPAPSVTAFSASPTTIETGQSTSLAWSTSGATSCTATGGDGSDGWSGAEPVSSTGTTVGPINATGSETYTLTCTGAGGTSAPASVSVTVTASPPPASISSFTATPSSLQAGNASSLTWSSSNATSCTAGGGTGSDGWGGTVATSSTGTSTGALATGTYTYTLTCSGPGGSSATSSAVVTVTSAPPAASISSFTATPNALTTGQSTTLTWATSAATSCTASGGTGSDGWNGTKPVSSTGTPVGPINTAGNYEYTLLCTGAGGNSAPRSVNVTVTAPMPASITTFQATPSSLTAGQSASLSWTTSAATSCTGTGGTGSDGWAGAKGTSSTGTSTGPLSTAGTVTYTLTCTGGGGTSAPSSTRVTVNPVVPVQPTVTLLADGAASATVLTGSEVTFSWSSSHATSCTASGGSNSDWSGTQSTSNSGVLVGPVSSVPGIYAYTLTCSGPGGSGSSTVQLTIMPPNGSDCGVGVPTTDLVTPAASATGTVNGICLLCSVSDPGYLVDAPTNNYATMVQPVGVVGSTSLTVNGTTTYPAGRTVGFVLAEGNQLLSANVLQGLTVETLIGNTVQESVTGAGLLGLDALGLIAVNPDAGYVSFTTTKPFNSVELIATSLASVLATYKVYDACVTLK